MRKNKIMRFASMLLVLTLLSTCAISGTFAKYTTSDSASDSARVAKWGVEISASAQFADNYVDQAGGNIGTTATTNVTVATATAGDAVIAPGTKGSLGGFDISGTPEVATTVTYSSAVTLTGWALADGTYYCPITITVDGAAFSGLDYDTLDAFQSAVNAKLINETGKRVEPNQSVAAGVSVSWEWPFENATGSKANQSNENDTALGNLATAPTIGFSCSAAVTQID